MVSWISVHWCVGKCLTSSPGKKKPDLRQLPISVVWMSLPPWSIASNQPDLTEHRFWEKWKSGVPNWVWPFSSGSTSMGHTSEWEKTSFSFPRPGYSSVFCLHYVKHFPHLAIPCSSFRSVYKRSLATKSKLGRFPSYSSGYPTS